MDDPAETETGESPTANGAGDPARAPRVEGKDARPTGRADVKVRITPRSLLFSSALGATVLGVVSTGGLLLLPAGPTFSEPTAALLSEWGPALLFAYAALLSVIFVVGYRRHGRPVPTVARARDGTLSVRVPEAWGTLIREEVHLDAPRLGGPRSEAPSGPGRDDPAPAAVPGGALRATGTAREWWDPGTYEVHADAAAAAVLKSGALGDSEERPDG
jgi:hypothetical protein